MTRLTLLGFAGALFASAPAGAQTTPDSLAADSVAVDSLAGPTYDTAAARVFNSEAVAAERDTLYAVALTKYDQALVADPTYPPALLGRGNMLSQLGRNADARSSYEAAVAAATVRGAEFDQVRTIAARNVEAVIGILAQEEEIARANASNAAQAAAIADQTAAVEAATALLATDPLTPESAQQAYDLLEQARASGYDPNNVAFYYAKALNALGRGADALPYAEQALAASTDADKSVFYIQIGIAYRFMANDTAAREAFTAAKTGSWAGWADHYLAEMGDPPAPTTP